ncbi:hypothetical protein OESDEN_07766 [Oesophagostomum dentatum]|uniref:Uncharacterized protein n=1 Tax=Oesophagostomum dentatum TaxID=61180 RepID=A0A0B1T870_OESDE|nr:hypothetical protein OESDEN_07766 [Oesophagostomum dentatum]
MLYDMITEDSELVEVNSRVQHPEIKLEPPPSTSVDAPAASAMTSSLSQLVALPHSTSVVSQSQKPEPSAISSPTVSTKSTETGTSVLLRSAEETTNG